MVVDGAVVMVENILRHLAHRREQREPVIAADRSARPRTKCSGPCSTRSRIIITAYLPIFTLQRVEGRLFQPMAWTVAFALLGALLFSMLIAPVLASFLFRKRTSRSGTIRCWTWLTDGYRARCSWCDPASLGHGRRSRRRRSGGCRVWLCSGAIGSEFLPHLDEGAIWARGTLAPSTGPTRRHRAS